MTKYLIVLAGVISMLACAAGSDVPEEPVVEPATNEVELASEILERPFTAEQIRGEWVDGLRITIRKWSPEAEVFELWTVVQTDAEGVDIESAVLGESGVGVGEAVSHHSGWVELRDHASFPADRATRDRVTRETALGELDGWLYTVADPDGSRKSEFFFAESLPGAPVFVHVLQGGEVVEIFEQVERSGQ